MTRLLRIGVYTGLFAFSAFVAAAGYVYYLSLPVDDSDSDPVAFRIESGESVGRIAKRLEQAQLVRSVLPLRVISKLSSSDTRFQHGNYALRRSMSAVQIHDHLVSGNQVLTRVTIPEGRTTRQIAGILERSGVTPADEFLAAATNTALLEKLRVPAESADGYVFPDTYLFPEEYPAELVLRTMVSGFFDNLERIDPHFRDLDPEELHERVIVASIVEREYITDEEAPLIASVFYNRLEAKMRLESCATVVYVMTEEEGLPHPDRLFYRDLERQSEYNTYLHSGLPPGPIANPGAVSLNAALNPADSDYWFFVLRGPNAKEHYFSRTLHEHNQATVLYLRSP